MNGPTLISASIQGGVLALAVWLIVLAMPTMPPLAKVWLWRLVFLKFALGFVGIGNIPLPVLPAPPAPEVTVSTATDDSVAYETIDSGAVSLPLVIPAPTKREVPWGWLWLAGVGVVGSYALYGMGKTARMVRRAEPVTESWVLHDLSELTHAAGIRRIPRLLESAETKTALLAWSLRPAILLPAGLMAEGSDVSADLRLMLAHEVAHLVNRDLIWNLLATGVKGAFFFHPLVWLSAGRSQIAQETAADERAVRMTGTSLQEYGEMLLRATVASNAFRAIPGAVAIAGSVRSLRERLNAMSKLSEKPPLPLRIAAFAAIAALFPGYCLVAKAQSVPHLKPAVSTPAKKVQKPARRKYVSRDEGTLIVTTEGNTLAFIPSPQRTSIDWIRFDPETGNVTDGWRMNMTWDGKKYANPVWTRIDPVTKKKMFIYDDSNATWTQVVNGKVVAVRRRGKVVKTATSLLPSRGIAMPPQVAVAAARPGVTIPSNQLPMPNAGFAPTAPRSPEVRAGAATPAQTAAAPAVAAGGPTAPASGIAPAAVGRTGAVPTTLPPASDIATAGSRPAVVSSPAASPAGVSTAAASSGMAQTSPAQAGPGPRGVGRAGSRPALIPPGQPLPPSAIPPAAAAAPGNAQPVPNQVLIPASPAVTRPSLSRTPKATKRTPKHRKRHTTHKPK